MKKITLTLLALVCALCCALGLVACGGEPDSGDGGTQTVAVESVTLNKTTLTLEIDGEETLTATVTPDNATNKTVTWSSSAPTIASVDNTGKVTAKAEGTATITATTANNKTATCDVTVNASAPFSLAGKTFVFSDVTSTSEEDVTAAKQQMGGATIAFTVDGKFTLTMLPMTIHGTEYTILQKGIYTFENGTGTITTTMQISNGIENNIPNEETSTQTLTYTDGTLLQSLDGVTMIWVLQD